MVVVYFIDNHAEFCHHQSISNIEQDIAGGNLSHAQSLLNYGINDLSNTNLDTVTGVLMADGVNANYVVNNYLDYYNIELRNAQGMMTRADSIRIAQLADLCPLTDSWIVYQAQALYSNLFSNYKVWEGNCDNDTGASRHSFPGNNVISEKGGTQQHFNLFPNPNDGNITLIQSIQDELPVIAEILNVQGLVVNRIELNFTNKQAKLQLLNLPVGIYLLKLRDNTGATFNFKFVKQ